MLARKELFDAPQSQFDQYYIRYIYVIMLLFLSFGGIALRYLAFLLPAQPSQDLIFAMRLRGINMYMLAPTVEGAVGPALTLTLCQAWFVFPALYVGQGAGSVPSWVSGLRFLSDSEQRGALRFYIVPSYYNSCDYPLSESFFRLFSESCLLWKRLRLIRPFLAFLTLSGNLRKQGGRCKCLSGSIIWGIRELEGGVSG